MQTSPTNGQPTHQLIGLNIGGTKYLTTRETLLKNGENFFTSLLAGRIPTAKDKHGNYFIDRNGKLFMPILDLLRTGELVVPPDLTLSQIKKECQFYMINHHSSPAGASDDDLTNLIKSAKSNAIDIAYQRDFENYSAQWQVLEEEIITSFQSDASSGVALSPIKVYSNVFEATTQLINEKCQRSQGVEDKRTGEKLAEWVAKMQCSQEVQIQKFHGNLYEAAKCSNFLVYMRNKHNLSLESTSGWIGWTNTENGIRLIEKYSKDDQEFHYFSAAQIILIWWAKHRSTSLAQQYTSHIIHW